MSTNKYEISIVSPVYNEVKSLKSLHQEIILTCKKIGKKFEIIFIDDGSTDGSDKVLESLCPLKVITFRKNFGQTASIDAGIKHAKGKYIVTIDSDGQNDPADIKKLYDKITKTNFDMVVGWRKNRKDSLTKKASSRMASIVRKLMINDGIHDSGCTLKIFKRNIFDNINLYGEMHRYIPALAKIDGYVITEIIVNHRKRMFGKTKYNWHRGYKGMLDLFSVWFWKKFANRPLHLIGGSGILLIFLGILSMIAAILYKIYLNQDLSETALTYLSIISITAGVQMLLLGLISDMVAKSYYDQTKSNYYKIKKIKNI